jgi:hypothetical protein
MDPKVKRQAELSFPDDLWQLGSTFKFSPVPVGCVCRPWIFVRLFTACLYTTLGMASSTEGERQLKRVRAIRERLGELVKMIRESMRERD